MRSRTPPLFPLPPTASTSCLTSCNNNLSSQLVQFIASHFVGTQKLQPGENARYVGDNPNWVLLDYRLATTAGPVDFINNGQWGSDWSYVNAQESWFLHNADGQRLYNSQWDWYQMDINNPDWRQYWLNTVINNLPPTAPRACSPTASRPASATSGTTSTTPGSPAPTPPTRPPGPTA